MWNPLGGLSLACGGATSRLLLDQLAANLAGAVQLRVDVDVPEAVHQLLDLLRADLGRAGEFADRLAGVVDGDGDVARFAVSRGPVNVDCHDFAGERVIFDDPGRAEEEGRAP